MHVGSSLVRRGSAPSGSRTALSVARGAIAPRAQDAALVAGDVDDGGGLAARATGRRR